MPDRKTETTDFGFRDIPEAQKAAQVHAVFASVARKYDLMNDILSFGMHRLWKRATVRKAALAPGMRVLDIASGTGDLAIAEIAHVLPGGEVLATDINPDMLEVARRRIKAKGLAVQTAVCDAEALPFEDGRFDVVTVAFGIRNMTHKDRALSEMLRVLKPGGRLLVLEFSRVRKILSPFYDFYSLVVMPAIGRLVTQDGPSYRYLAESIRRHPAQEPFAQMIRQAGFEDVTWEDFTFGVCALHAGRKP